MDSTNPPEDPSPPEAPEEHKHHKKLGLSGRLKKLAGVSESVKKIWGLVALIVGLGVTWGTLTAKLEDTRSDVKDLKQELKRSVDKLDGRIDTRFDRAHDAIEKRFSSGDMTMVGLRDAVQRLVVLEEVRSGRTPYRRVHTPPVGMGHAMGMMGVAGSGGGVEAEDHHTTTTKVKRPAKLPIVPRPDQIRMAQDDAAAAMRVLTRQRAPSPLSAF